jgi:hypothetical protein
MLCLLYIKVLIVKDKSTPSPPEASRDSGQLRIQRVVVLALWCLHGDI